MLGIKPDDRDHFLTLCFCCPCCCVAMRNMPRWAPEVKARMHTLDGLRIEVNDACNGCGRCVDACFAGAIAIRDGTRGHRRRLQGVRHLRLHLLAPGH